MNINKIDYDDIIKYLNNSALYHMSLSAMELFHSNFWRWLMEYNIKYVEIFFDELTNINHKDVSIKREFNHTDISIEANGKLFIVENKFKSLVNKEQLERYENDLIDKFSKGKYLFPIWMQKYKDLFSGTNNTNWEFLDYETIMNNIERISNEIFNDSQKVTDTNYKIIEEYLKMTRNLIKLFYYVINTHFKEKLIVNDKNIFENLQTIRLHDIMSKINSELLKDKLYERLKKEFPNSYCKIVIKSDYNNGAYLQARWKVPYDNNDPSKGYFLIGPHLQDSNFDTMIHMCVDHLGLKGLKQLKKKDEKKMRNIIDKIYAAVEPIIFKKDTYDKCSKNKFYNEFKGIEDEFEYLSIYRHKKIYDQKKHIDTTSFDELCDEFVRILKLFENINKDDLIDKIKKSVE